MDDTTNTTPATEENTTPSAEETTENTPAAEEKTFTQAELDRIVQREKAKASKGKPSKEEWAEFQEYKKSKQTDSEKIADLQKRHDELAAENAALKNSSAAVAAGCKPEFSEFVVHKVSQMDGEFSDNLEAFKAENPQYFGGNEKPEKPTVTLGTSPKISGGNSGMTRDEIVSISDPVKRQAAMRANIHLFR